MKHLLIPLAFALAGCEQAILSSEYRSDFPGAVYQITDHTVTIRGIFDPLAGPASPNSAMRAQAEAVCPGATYISATPYPYDYYTFLYLFTCNRS